MVRDRHRALPRGLGRVRAAVVLGTLGVLAAAAVVLPGRAPAGQSSPATSAVAQIGAGLYHSCALIDEGTRPGPASRPVRCWGFSGNGQVGYGNTRVIGDNEVPAAAGPVDLGAGRTAKALAVGDYHTCAVVDDGSVRCWGYGNEGQLGYGSRNHVGDDEVPAAAGAVDLGAGRKATAITAGGNHTCAILDDGNVRCWGLGEYGQLGNGATASIGDGERPGEVDPVNLSGHTATAITAGAFHSCAILDDGGNVRCWGLGGNGQLGYGRTSAVRDPAREAAPVDLGVGRTARAITAGFGHTCAVLDNGSVRCWGLNDSGELGYGNRISIGDNETPGSVGPVDLGLGRTATAISAGGNHTCAVLDDGTVRCWGSPRYGQLGYGDLNAVGDDEAPGSAGPVDLGAGRRATAVVAGIYHTCARLDDGSVRCWGNGADGRLGLCRRADVGDDERPSAVERVDLGAGGAACPQATPTPTPEATVTAPTPSPGGPPATPPAPEPEDPLRAEKARAQALRECRAEVRGESRDARRKALRRRRAGRAVALRRAARRAARARARCVRRFGRTPGRVATLAASAVGGRKIVLTFRAPASNGSSAPAARSYVIKQSLRPIRTARDFRRAHTLCRRVCSFDVIALDAEITLEVTELRRRTTYFYSVAARDNVSGRTGPRSKAVRARTG